MLPLTWIVTRLLKKYGDEYTVWDSEYFVFSFSKIEILLYIIIGSLFLLRVVN